MRGKTLEVLSIGALLEMIGSVGEATEKLSNLKQKLWG